MRTLKRIAIPLAIGALAAGLFAWLHGPEGNTVPASSFAPARMPALPAQGHTQARPAAHPAAQPAAHPADEPPLRVQVERLLATHDPADALRAYWLVADCASFNLNHDRVVFDEDDFAHPKPGALPGFRGLTDEEKRHDDRQCSGMTERERQSRLDYLTIAAKAGVMGAAIAFAREGPFGDPSALQTRPDDPLVQAWRATAMAQLTQAAEGRAELGAIAYLADAYADGSTLTAQDRLQAYRYRLATNLIQGELFSSDDSLAKILASQREYLSGSIQDFSPEQRDAELAAARRIADVARARREQARKATRGSGG